MCSYIKERKMCHHIRKPLTEQTHHLLRVFIFKDKWQEGINVLRKKVDNVHAIIVLLFW